MSVVSLHLWGVSTRGIASAVARIASQRFLMSNVDGLTFVKLLGTANSRTFTPRSTDPRHWGLLAVFDTHEQADNFDDGPKIRSWERVADESLVVRMTPLMSRGTWSSREPFGQPQPRKHDGPVAGITRARIKPSRTREFWAASEDVANELAQTDGLIVATGIGEAPVGLQGTFSLWESPSAMNTFAHGAAAHVDAIARTPDVGWYAEELFARLAVDHAQGVFAGRAVSI